MFIPNLAEPVTYILQRFLLADTYDFQRGKIDMDLSVVPLHKHYEYMKPCCDLINDEWKRSETARLRSLESSSDSLPTCLILLKDKHVIGHCKLSPIPSIKDACFIESVVIDKTLRGKGYGTYLMEKAEDYCRTELNLNAIYLSTKGQELFYKKLGYNKCQPISIYGTFINNNPSNDKQVIHNAIKHKYDKIQNVGPPPPPMPNNVTNNTNEKVYMNKFL